MRPLSLSVCSQCRHTLFSSPPESWMPMASLAFRRHRSGGNSNKNPRSSKYGSGIQRPFDRSTKFIPYNVYNKRFQNSAELELETVPPVDPDNIPAFFEAQVKPWSKSRLLHTRLQSFGIPAAEVDPLLKTFVRAVELGQLSTPEGHERYVLSRFVDFLKDGDRFRSIDSIYSTILFNWAGDPAHSGLLRSAGLTSSTISQVQALSRAGDRFYPAERFPQTRREPRKVIMHVGPTNSGKTHNALRALAAADTGVYAGPLRLLAHEIWERLNLGQIIPLGETEEAPKPISENTTTALDAPVSPRLGNPKYARLCNMITGEEQRIVSDHATLMSCTVEMINLTRNFDVAVIDEIQMIGDEARGSAWTTAVLGTCARELHLCGEETAVPIVQALLSNTGDELVIKRYERLSPLYVEEESLNGDLSLVRKGDCIVTFSRASIFAIKRRIEALTPLRCAVAYGRLPPEIRNEQAALFNDPESGYDVIIGSDAIGMGLNLKIRRIIFETTMKFNGQQEIPLSISQTKQIGGRAGRYGLNGNETPGGLVTSFLPKDMPHIRKCLAAGPTPLPYGRLGIDRESIYAFSLALPENTPARALLEAHEYISCMPGYLRQEKIAEKAMESICDFIDNTAKYLPMKERMLCHGAPIPHRDADSRAIIESFLKAHNKKLSVDLWGILSGLPVIENLEAVEARIKEENMTINGSMLVGLETLHKVVVFYAWMTFRRPVVWNCFKEVGELKTRVERALEWALQAMTKTREGTHGTMERLNWSEYLEAKKGKASETKVAFKRGFSHETPYTAMPLAEDAPRGVLAKHT